MTLSKGWRAAGLVAIVTLIMVLSSTIAAVAIAGPTAPSSRAVAPSAASIPAVPTAAPASSPASSSAAPATDPARAAAVDSARQAFLNSGVSLSDFLPPTLNAAPGPTTQTDNHIVPLYDYSAAPMGISTLGLENTSGTTTPYILNTTSLEGTFSTGDPLGVQPLSPYYGTLQAYGDQLNTVLVNTTIFGQGGYDYWLQNVITYTASTNTLSFVLNIWNFSSPSFDFPSNGILHGNGRVVSSEVYEASGPRMTIAYPFTLDLYLNTTVGSYSGSPMVNEVYFNYTVLNGLGQVVCPTSEPTGDVCGMYDNVYFNSGVSVPKGSAQIEANGFQYTPCGLPADMEMDVGIGQSDGANANMVYANATVGIYALNATTHTYQAPPSAYNFGSETGETGTGVLTTWNVVNGQPVAYLRSGPSLLSGLWNVTGSTDGAPTLGSESAGAYALNYATVAPGNAFVAIAQGSGVTNQSFFQVAPTFGWFSGKGAIGQNIWLAPGEYTVEVMLSGYDESTQSVDLTGNSSLTATLSASVSPNVYTPLWAFSNQDLANLSVSGSGTSGSPYVLLGTQSGSIAPVFGILNDYLFIVYSGVWINATTAYFQFNPPPSLEITEPSWWYFQTNSLAASYGATLPYNQMPMYFYHTQNFVVENGSDIGLWSGNQVGHNFAAYCNVCSNSLFASNTFNVSSEGLDMLGAGAAQNNYVWGNTFLPYSNSAYPGASLPSTGLVLAESGDHVYNNAFYTNLTASASATYTDFWNATGGYQPASNSLTVNGVALTGSILGTSVQGGNYWANYGALNNAYGVLPYADREPGRGGAITANIGKGGDTSPLVTLPSDCSACELGVGLYHVTFTETGLPSGTSWTVRVLNEPIYEPALVTTYYSSPTNTSTTSSIGFWVPNGTYSYTVSTTNKLYSAPGSMITVNGANLPVTVTFTLVTYAVTFSESGLPSGTTWFVSLNSVPKSSSGTTISYTESNATYPYTITAPNGFTSTVTTGSVVVNGGPQNVATVMAPWATGGVAISVLYGVYNGRSDLQSMFPNIESNLTNFTALVDWAGGVVTGATSDAANATLSPYGYWYDLMMVYDQRGDLQYAFVNAYTDLTNYTLLVNWAGGVVSGALTDSAAATLQPFGWYYDLRMVYDGRGDLQAAFPNAYTNTTEYNLLIDWAGGVAIGSYVDSSASTLAPYDYWYALMVVYNSRGDLQAAYPNVLTDSATNHGLFVWAKDVVTHKFPDSSYSKLLPFAAEYEALG